MGLQLNFDARAVAPASVDGGGDQLPVSDALGHRVVIISDAQVPTKANVNSQGQDSSTMLVLKLEVIEGPYQGMKGDYRLNIGNVKQEPRDIAYRQLSALCHAIGVFSVGNTQELYGKPFRAVVEQQAPPQEKYTQIKGVLTDQGIDPGNPTAGPRHASPATPPAPATFTPPPAPATFTPQPAPAPAPAPASAFAAPAPQPQPQAQPQQQQPWTPPANNAPPPPAPWGQQPQR